MVSNRNSIIMLIYKFNFIIMHDMPRAEKDCSEKGFKKPSLIIKSKANENESIFNSLRIYILYVIIIIHYYNMKLSIRSYCFL